MTSTPSDTHLDTSLQQAGQTGQIRKALLRQIFSGSFMQRWNDRLRPCQLFEIDKQAHKMIAASLLLSRACQGQPEESYYALSERIIEGAIFDYLFRTVTTDIKPQLFYRIQANEEHCAKLAAYVLRELDPILSSLGHEFKERFAAWHKDRDFHTKERRLLKAAHLTASYWEFKLIEPLNSFDAEMKDIDADMRGRLNELCPYAAGLEDILDKDTAIGRFASFCGQLRFQVRWTTIPRIPQTDVLGHTFFVAAASYLYSRILGLCQARRVNNFFAGLFHDLPELLTRDIITPVKQSSPDISQLIHHYEQEEMQDHVYGPLLKGGETDFVRRLGYYLGQGLDSEFCERIQKEPGKVQVLKSFEELDQSADQNSCNGLDGALVKACDKLSAFLEADESIRNGIASAYLCSARMRLKEDLSDASGRTIPACLGMDSLMADFD